MNKDVYLILPKDLGDCVIASQHVKEVKEYCLREDKNLVVWGGKFQAGLFKIFADVDLEVQEPKQNVKADKVIDFNFYQSDLLANFTEDTPIYSADKIFEAPCEGYVHEGRKVGEGCLIGRQHIYDSLSDALKDSEIISKKHRVSYPVLPDRIKNPEYRASVLEKLDIKGDYAVLVPVCAPTRPNKRWQPEKFAEIAKQLAAENITPLIVGGPADDEKELTARINEMSGGVCKPVHVGINEISTVLSGAAFTLSNDTGMLHISAAGGTPTVLVGDDWYLSPETWAPLQDNFRMAHVEDKSVKQLTVDEVSLQTKEAVIDIRKKQTFIAKVENIEKPSL